MEIADSISQNNTILRVGVHFMSLGPRATVQEHLKKNWDRRMYLNGSVLKVLIKNSISVFCFSSSEASK
jgi:hypothetical protein